MSSRDLSVRRSSGLFAVLHGNSTAKEIASIQEAALVDRTRSAFRRDLALLRMTDIGVLTDAGIDHAADIADRMVARIEANPYATKAVTRVGETAVRGLDRELARFIDGH